MLSSTGRDMAPTTYSLMAVLLALGASCAVVAGEVDTPEYLADLAQVESQHGHQAQAIAHFRQALAGTLDPERRWTCKEGLARALAASGDANALTALAQEMASDGDPVRASTGASLLADQELAAGKGAAAVRRLAQLALESPIASFRDAARTRLAALPAATVDEVRQEAVTRLMANPSDAEARELALILTPDPNQRASLLKTASAAHPEDVELRLRTAETLLSASQPAEAKALLVRLRHDQPGLAEDIDRQLAAAAMALGDTAGAEQAVLSSAAGQDDDLRRSLYLSRTFASVGLWAQAERQARLAVTRAADQGDAIRATAAIELGDALVHLGRQAEAEPLLRPIADQSIWPGLRERAERLLALPALVNAPILPH